MMSKIYLVMEGYYNDIRAAFSTYEHARGFMDIVEKADDSDDMRIETHTVDAPETKNLVIKENWQISVWLRSGWMTQGWSKSEGVEGKLHRQGIKVAAPKGVEHTIDSYIDCDGNPFLIVTSYKSLEEAMKLAQFQVVNYGK